MQKHETDPEALLEIFQKTLIQAGIKVTHQRLEIFKELCKTAGHPDAETIYKNIASKLPTISLDTVYRTLQLFAKLGLIDIFGTQYSRMRFDTNTKPHHHFICTNCGTIYDFYSEELSNLNIPDAVRKIGEIQKIQLEIKGICHQCANEAESTKT